MGVEGTPLEGMVALVTGASRGIGEGIARRFAAAGAAVAVSARTVEEGDHPLPGSVTTTVRAITDAGGTAVAFAADLARREDRERLVAEVARRLGPVDVLVNNAAVTYLEPVVGFTSRHWDTMVEVQVRAPFELAQLVLPGMRERGRGWVLNISSGAARHPAGPPYRRGLGGGGTVYGMCKAALERLTTGLASEVYEDNISVNVVSPGLVDTPGVAVHGLITEATKDRVQPIKYIAEAVYQLATGDPKTTTGQIAYAAEFLQAIAVEPSELVGA
jgi:citronellol/citronellal dehydrogenase